MGRVKSGDLQLLCDRSLEESAQAKPAMTSRASNPPARAPSPMWRTEPSNCRMPGGCAILCGAPIRWATRRAGLKKSPPGPTAPAVQFPEGKPVAPPQTLHRLHEQNAQTSSVRAAVMLFSFPMTLLPGGAGNKEPGRDDGTAKSLIHRPLGRSSLHRPVSALLPRQLPRVEDKRNKTSFGARAQDSMAALKPVRRRGRAGLSCPLRL